jgi:hypothetical protein
MSGTVVGSAPVARTGAPILSSARAVEFGPKEPFIVAHAVMGR